MKHITGFNNTQVLCWLNSLIQSLLSFDSTYNFFIKNKTTDSSSHISRQLTTLFKQLDELEDVSGMSTDLLNSLVRDLKKNNRKIDLSSGQQSSSEGLILILEIINNKELDRLFNHVYEIVIVCNQTNKIVSKKRDTGNVFYLWQFNESQLLDTPLEDVILYHIDECDDSYKPDKNHKEGYTYKKITKLRRIPQIVVIALNRYMTDGKKYVPRNQQIKLPYEFKIPSNKDEDMIYRKKAEIDHLGSLNGGHYVCRAERDKKTYLFNDSSYKLHEFGTLPSTYLTFYERC